jgi:hypothetical protein
MTFPTVTRKQRRTAYTKRIAVNAARALAKKIEQALKQVKQ